MNEFWTKFLSGIGVSKEITDALSNEEKGADFDVKKLIETHQSVQEKLFENKNKDRIVDQRELDKKFDILRGTLAQKLNRRFNLDYTRNELETMDFDAVLEVAFENTKKAIEESQAKNDNELVTQVKEIKEKLRLKQEENHNYKEKYDTELNKVKTDFDRQLNTIKVDSLFESEYEKYTFGLEPMLIPIVKKQVKEEILNKYEVKADGSLAGKDGTHAEDFEGRGLFDKVEQPVKYLLTKYNAIAKSQIVDDPKVGRTQGNVVPEKLSAQAQGLLNRMKKSAVN